MLKTYYCSYLNNWLIIQGNIIIDEEIEVDNNFHVVERKREEEREEKKNIATWLKTPS